MPRFFAAHERKFFPSVGKAILAAFGNKNAQFRSIRLMPVAREESQGPNTTHHMTTAFSNEERRQIEKYFGRRLEELTEPVFTRTLKALRTKYHPDNFAQFDDATIQEMATERFQDIETLGAKLKQHFAGTLPEATAPAQTAPVYMNPAAVFKARKLKVEILTRDKDLKYHLFGRFLRWLSFGETFTIPGTGATLIMDETHRGVRIGYTETIRLYLTFDESDAPEDIIDWLFPRIQDSATSLIINQETVPLRYDAVVAALRQHSFLRIGTG